TGTLSFTEAKPAAIRDLVMDRVDPELFGWSYDFVGDLAETAALIWPEPTGELPPPPLLSEVVMALANARRGEVADLVAGWLDRLDPAEFRAEWKWDGIRVQIVGRQAGDARLYSRTGDDVAPAFPDMLPNLGFDAVLDGELLVMRGGEVAPFNDLQQRLNRKK